MRSLLFVPADSPRKLEKSVSSGADALILDLEDSVAGDRKAAARATALAFLREWRNESGVPRIFVRINALGSGLSSLDLDVVMTGAPDGIMLPKATGGADITLLDARLAVREALHDLPPGSTGILAIATETPSAIFGLGTYKGASARLGGLSWGAEDLSAEIGALATREPSGAWTEPFRLARGLVLFAAHAAGTAAIDTVYVNFRDQSGLRAEAAQAARDGFTAKLAIHPDQVPVINEAFTPDQAAVARAERVVAAFAEAGQSGVASLDGTMLDRPHLVLARRILSRAEARR
ncbi:HpcH/HpaI aldolase/citrate lyase family protein [Propylenella binzhouense]|uniref:CoA ester lyase n=1 Tax=Propylenella binzhouense TaxID=2555902 RepID=A0A964T4R0_9HYPH|nr:CoA ester lyase [Propylenella binzhouense]MYZ47849.1 CoA ester lyase [Propylenella binzhouense]